MNIVAEAKMTVNETPPPPATVREQARIVVAPRPVRRWFCGLDFSGAVPEKVAWFTAMRCADGQPVRIDGTAVTGVTPAHLAIVMANLFPDAVEQVREDGAWVARARGGAA